LIFAQQYRVSASSRCGRLPVRMTPAKTPPRTAPEKSKTAPSLFTSDTSFFSDSSYQSINHQSCIFRVVQVIKSLQDPLEVGNNLTGINDMSGNEAWNRNVLNADGRLTETGQISLSVSYTPFTLHFCPQRCRSRQIS